MTDHTQLAIYLTSLFLENIKGLEKVNGQYAIPKAYKIARVNEFNNLLNGGHTEEELVSLMEQVKAKHGNPIVLASAHELFEYFDLPYKSVQVPREKGNLLTVGKSYVHPYLQITSPPPSMRIVDSEIIVKEVPFFLEFKTSFSIQDLHDYYAMKMEISNILTPQLKGSYEYLLKHYDVELLLFMIDESWAHHQSMNAPYPKNPLRLSDFEEPGSELYFLRRDVCEEGGFLHGVPRRA